MELGRIKTICDTPLDVSVEFMVQVASLLSACTRWSARASKRCLRLPPLVKSLYFVSIQSYRAQMPWGIQNSSWSRDFRYRLGRVWYAKGYY